MTMPSHKLDDLKAKWEAAKSDYLRSWGWTETCQTPGSYWLWSRDFSDYDRQFDAWHAAHPDKPARVPTGIIKVPMDLAISMTRACLEQGEED